MGKFGEWLERRAIRARRRPGTDLRVNPDSSGLTDDVDQLLGAGHGGYVIDSVNTGLSYHTPDETNHNKFNPLPETG